jgi:hypothetical protein
MNTRSPFSPEIRAVLDQERVISPVAASQRARVIARARASLEAPVAATSVFSTSAPRTRWPAAAAAALVVTAAVGAAAYEIHARMARDPVTPATTTVAPVSGLAPSAPAPSPPAAADGDLVPAPEPAVSAPRLSSAGSAREELRLLRQARAAVARNEFAVALVPIAEHARRFRNGRLAEEREALRVKVLVGLGRTNEARRAASDFQKHFPRSVLLPTVSQMSVSGR